MTLPSDRSAAPTDSEPPLGAQLSAKTASLDTALEQLQVAAAFVKPRYQTQVYRLATELMSSTVGMLALLDRAEAMTRAGVFHGGPWDDPSKLLPHLVGVGLKGDGVYSTVEALSELRMLALATERFTDPRLDASGAATFLREACAQNLELMFVDPSEETRRRPNIYARAERLFQLICDQISVEGLKQTVVDEIEQICAQRPIVTRRVRRLLDQAQRLPDDEQGGADSAQHRLARYLRAANAASDGARRAGDLAGYLKALRGMDSSQLEAEAGCFAHALASTSLASPFHAVLLRWLAKRATDQLPLALGLNDAGRACATDNLELTALLVRLAIYPETSFAITGLAGLLERGLLSRPEVAAGLRRLTDIDILPQARDDLHALCAREAGLSANSILVAGAIGVLGQPLGIGQGNNPTCQAARGISLWSQHAPGMLLGMVASAVRDGFVRLEFDGQDLRSSESLPGATPTTMDLDLDPVSAVLVPHLDRLYARLLQLASARGEDPHKWVNPAMYGRWVVTGFASTFHPLTGAVVAHEAFVRRFFATHHPDYNDGYELIYPNPVGLMVTDVHGNMLGPHAVSIQRITEAPSGEQRVYFFNPNNEGRQRWGHGVAPTVAGHGEIPGESSLPFGQFVSRLYAFHFDPYEQGEAYAVPTEEVQRVSAMARDSWGRGCTWVDEPAAMG